MKRNQSRNLLAADPEADFDTLFPARPIAPPVPEKPRDSTTHIGHNKPAPPGRIEPTTPAWNAVDDPRPDLRNDSALWRWTLKLAFIHDGQKEAGSFALLHALRCEGAHLKARPDRLYLDRGNERPRLPGVAPLSAEQLAEREITAEDWVEVWLPKLGEKREEVVEILTKAAKPS